jgi:hypothetical protein
MKRMTYAQQRKALNNMGTHMTVDAMFELLNQPQHVRSIKACATPIARKRKVLAICRKHGLLMQYVTEIVERVYARSAA